jgi:uncharacterized protein (TIGR03067 family)
MWTINLILLPSEKTNLPPMKKQILLFIALLGISHAFAQRTSPSSLDGTWIPSTQEMGGKELPAAVFANQQLILADSTYTVIAESVDKGVVMYHGMQMDIYGREGVNQGRHFTAIFKKEKGMLTICYNLKGDVYPSDFNTKDKPLYFLSVFKKKDTK